ncbi:MAG TPA: hypothetical protein VGO93_13980 [Candidatus Xenobia bacterium]|jgi:predicted DNA binding CopG/RHH family protein
MSAEPIYDTQIHVRLTQHQAAVVRCLAAEQGLPPSTYVRQLVLARLRTAEEAARPVYR